MSIGITMNNTTCGISEDVFLCSRSACYITIGITMNNTTCGISEDVFLCSRSANIVLSESKH